MVQTTRPLTLAGLCAAALMLAGCPAPAVRPTPPPAPGPATRLPPTLPAPKSSTPPASGQPSPPSPPTSRTPLPQRQNHLSAATQSLVTQARTLIGQGDLDGASTTLDRALRIEPNNPLLWIERGRLRLAEQNAHQAESCGRKALALASGDPAAQKQAGRLLAEALRAQGRNQEAQDVDGKPFMN